MCVCFFFVQHRPSSIVTIIIYDNAIVRNNCGSNSNQSNLPTAASSLFTVFLTPRAAAATSFTLAWFLPKINIRQEIDLNPLKCLAICFFMTKHTLTTRNFHQDLCLSLNETTETTKTNDKFHAYHKLISPQTFHELCFEFDSTC